MFHLELLTNYKFLMPYISVKSVIATCCFFVVVNQSGAQRLHMIPNVKEQVVQANSPLTLTCVYEYQDDFGKSNISWTLPAYLEKFPMVK